MMTIKPVRKCIKEKGYWVFEESEKSITNTTTIRYVISCAIVDKSSRDCKVIFLHRDTAI